MNFWPSNGMPAMPTLTPWSPESIFTVLNLPAADATVSAVWPSANRALFVPFVLSIPQVATQGFALNGATVNGNIEVGIYDAFGVKLTSAVNAAQSGTSAFQIFDFTDIVLGPGKYYMAVAMSSGTGTLYRASGSNATDFEAAGILQMDTAYPLPAVATFAATGSAYLPYIGICFGKVLV